MARVIRILGALAIAGGLSVAFGSQLSAGHDRDYYRDPEASAVVDRLRHMGFVAWKDIDRRHRSWDIDDARRDNGKVYDLELERGSLDLVRLKRKDF